MNSTKKHCFFYINTAISCENDEIVKIGISYNPEKRITDFNNGIKHRNRGGHCDLVVFKRAYTIKLCNRKKAEKLESTFKKMNKLHLLRCYGSEVFNITLEDAVRMIPS